MPDGFAEVSQSQLALPSGEIAPAWVVTGGDDRAVFTGPNAADRAVTFARAQYGRCNFRMQAEPGHLGVFGRQLGAA